MMLPNEVVEHARNLDILTFFEQYCGFTFAHRGGAFRCKQHPSLAVKNDQRSWYWHSKSVGGYGALDYLIKVENMPFREAVKAVDPYLFTAVIADEEPEKSQRPKTLILPEKVGVPLRLYDYLCVKRGIDGEIVNSLIQKEMLYEDRRGNVVFVGFDEDNEPRFASLRGTHGDCSFRGDCRGSNKRYGFNVVPLTPLPPMQLYVYESPIDLMSHASLEKAATGAWERHSRLSLAGTSDTALIFFLNKHLFINELVFCLDNDPAGLEAAAVMTRKYAEKGYATRLELPKGKDFNEDLQAFHAAKKHKAHTPERVTL